MTHTSSPTPLLWSPRLEQQPIIALIGESADLILRSSGSWQTAAPLDYQFINYRSAEDARHDLPRLSNLAMVICCEQLMDALGLELLAYMRRDSQLKHLPFILLAEDSSMFRKAMLQGADDVLFPPFSKSELISAIQGRLCRLSALQT